MVSRSVLGLCIAVLCAAGGQLACQTPAAVNAPGGGGVRLAAAVPAMTSASTPSSTPAPANASPAVAEAEEPAPPCIDGEVAMGICLCPKGKGADATGHCVFLPCPKSDSGGVVFRDETTGQCMACAPGAKPTKDGKCEH